jgi:hypothetical protein
VPEPDRPDGALAAEVEVLTRTVDRLAGELAGLRQALATRAEIDQAKGALRAVSGVSSDEAFALLSQRSQNTNRKLGEVARDVLAELDGPSALSALRHMAKPGPEPAVPTTGHTWRTRRRWEPAIVAVREIDQLRALIDLGEHLAAAADVEAMQGALLGPVADGMGAFAAALALADHRGGLTVVHAGMAATALPDTLPLDAATPLTDAFRRGEPLLLSRDDLSSTYPDLRLADRVDGLAVLALGTDLAQLGAWLLCFDQPVPQDRETRAFFSTAARVVSAALHRARGPA